MVNASKGNAASLRSSLFGDDAAAAASAVPVGNHGAQGAQQTTLAKEGSRAAVALAEAEASGKSAAAQVSCWL